MKIRKITLRVQENNVNAIKLYEKYGYIKEGLIERGLLINGVFENVIIMGLNINHGT
jgi:RimJ/RimL family protein N-acetyltransferase